MKVKEIMSKPVVTASPDTGLKALAELLLSRRIGAVPIVDASGALVGSSRKRTS